MSVEVIETGEVVEPMGRVEAERITTRIADKLDSVADSYEQVMPLIREALTRQAHQALGYRSVTEYVSERFKRSLDRLPREVRVPVVHELSSAGMSTRAIAPIVGVSQKQVSNDQRSGEYYFSPAPDLRLSEGGESVDRSTGEVIEAGRPTASPPPRKVTGLDGRTYHTPPPAPARPPKRDPFTITELEPETPPRVSPKQRLADLPQEHWDKVNARQRVENMATALHTMSLLKTDAERARMHSAWATNPEAAGAFGGPLHTPDTIRALADLMRLYADEMEGRNAR